KQAGFSLHVANSLWGQKGISFRPPFLETLRTHFGGAFQEVDFQAGGADAINQWVKQQTHDQIPKMLEPQDITPLTRLILVNAIYLKGKWASRFRETSPFHFFPTPKEFFPHPIMSQANDFPYTQTKTVQVLEMPYQGETASMVVLLPLKRHGLAEVEELLTPENWSKWLGWLVKNKVNVYFPRLTLDHDYWLEKTLPAMGMALAFDPERADFSGMVESVRDDDQLHIKKVIHKVRVEIDEAGTEAAGASGVIHEEKSGVGAPRRFERPVEFMVNHPFVFLIRDRQTGSILFMGRVVDPRGK
ncbi:MAG: serpin family protein, partial [Candidatus Omnitrophica bacterium]|nr:serpin family protein [Candidatus Omnitrophota bacterium]